MQEKDAIQWFPGHMAKAIRQIKEQLKVIDCIIEILDARAPLSSRNPEISLINKERLIILTKSDLANEDTTKQWIKYFKKEKISVLSMDLMQGFNRQLIIKECEALLKDKLAREQAKGLKKRSIRAMVIGIPNVGKSTFINKMSGRKATRVANTPGHTRGQQWINADNIQLLDTPGILWPKFEDKETGIKLALIGTIKETIINEYQLSEHAISFLMRDYQSEFFKRFNLTNGDNILENIAFNRGLLLKQGKANITEAQKILLSEFKNGLIAKISLESPSNFNNA